MQHSDLFSQPVEVVEAAAYDKDSEPVQNPVFSDLEGRSENPAQRPASS
ncbi:hypothetical protein MANY_48620 [Mycolicibacterium anyangense]|uniref:Uncharacterized protein n=1 Tax=Mycolicibacterium anyangense TaxID=1431246 RepID=A0A6N4WFC4_9MYCO|nr:hypothetical protein [Mycolicibacterium anyangense]BBZ79525.1 hypothetical protein MANY_48620 [Mycolicibacterium anyangense]